MKKTSQTTFLFSTENRTIAVYGYMADTKEYIGKSDCYIPAGTGLPAYCTHIAPPVAGEGQAVIFNEQENSWQLVDDHRGNIAYNTETRRSETITYPGSLPDNLTLLPPNTEFDIWSGTAWVTDENAQREHQFQQWKAQKQQRLAIATQRIEVLTDSVNLRLTKDPETTRTVIEKWRTYRVQLDQMTFQSEDWPTPPEEV
ncbi:tail fiber assembly protein [Plesiomonas shigelloides]|uniref:tail fiber assembly protein n=1 Tax=Plesiomonas shigelloides TaxID=703 RepID=UPI001262A84C|nr:tail fiber assembly protein [Plesiomonas shigelloides]KAB7715700.1 tail fiber assembly protein [Plesiomonas shigelloides]